MPGHYDDGDRLPRRFDDPFEGDDEGRRAAIEERSAAIIAEQIDLLTALARVTGIDRADLERRGSDDASLDIEPPDDYVSDQEADEAADRYFR